MAFLEHITVVNDSREVLPVVTRRLKEDDRVLIGLPIDETLTGKRDHAVALPFLPGIHAGHTIIHEAAYIPSETDPRVTVRGKTRLGKSLAGVDIAYTLHAYNGEEGLLIEAEELNAKRLGMVLPLGEHMVQHHLDNALDSPISELQKRVNPRLAPHGKLVSLYIGTTRETGLVAVFQKIIHA